MKFKAHIHAVNASSRYSDENRDNNANSSLIKNSNACMTNLSDLFMVEHYMTRLFSEPENHNENRETDPC